MRGMVPLVASSDTLLKSTIASPWTSSRVVCGSQAEAPADRCDVSAPGDEGSRPRILKEARSIIGAASSVDVISPCRMSDHGAVAAQETLSDRLAMERLSSLFTTALLTRILQLVLRISRSVGGTLGGWMIDWHV